MRFGVPALSEATVRAKRERKRGCQIKIAPKTRWQEAHPSFANSEVKHSIISKVRISWVIQDWHLQLYHFMAMRYGT